MHLTQRLRWWFLPGLTAAGLLGLLVLLFARLANPVSLDDGLRHFAMGRFISENGISALDWTHFLPMSSFMMYHTDPWFLSGILFSVLSPLGARGAGIAMSLFSTAAVMSAFLLACRWFKLKSTYAAVLLVALIWFEVNFSYRLLLGRPFALIDALTIMTLAAILTRRWIWIFGALFVSTLLSQLFVFPLFCTLAGAVWLMIRKEGVDARRLMITALGGVLIGIILHPHAMEYVRYLVFAFIRIPFLGIDLGSEMNSSLPLLIRFAAALAMTILLGVTFIAKEPGWKRFHSTGASLLAAIILLFTPMFFLWSRAIDVLWPVTVLLIALLLAETPDLPSQMIKQILPSWGHVRPAIMAIVVLGLCLMTYVGISGALVSSDDQRSLDAYRTGLAPIPQHATILNPDWHLFAPAIAMRPDLTFVAGIDPSFTYLYDQTLHDLLAMTQTPIFRMQPPVIDARTWLVSTLSHAPADYLTLYRNRHPVLIEQMKGLGLKDLSPDAPFAVFGLRKS